MKNKLGISILVLLAIILAVLFIESSAHAQTTTTTPQYATESKRDTSNGSAYNWSSAGLNNCTANDGNVATFALPSNQFTGLIKADHFGFDIPLNKTITNIIFEVEKRKGFGNDLIDHDAVIFKNGIIQGQNKKITGKIWPTTADVFVQYGLGQQGGYDPLWGLQWTPQDINTSTFGFAFSADNQYTGLTTGSCDAVRAIVSYKDTYKFPFSWLKHLIPTVYATTTCSFDYQSPTTTSAVCTTENNTTTPPLNISNPTQDLFYGLALFFITFFGLIFYFKKGGE